MASPVHSRSPEAASNAAWPLLPSTTPGCHRDASTHTEAAGDPLPFQGWDGMGPDGIGWDGTGWESSTERKASNPYTKPLQSWRCHGWPSHLAEWGVRKAPQAPSLVFKREQHRHRGFVNDFLGLLFGQTGATAARLVL